MGDFHSVCVAMATYNGESYLSRQLDSIIEQSYPIKKIIITDDNSSDSTRAILEGYKEKNKDLIELYFNDANVGYIKNFEKAVMKCDGDFIALADQDDLWDKNKIECLVGAIGGKDLVYSDARLINADGEILAPSFTKYSNKKIGRIDFIDLCMNNTVTGCTLMFRSGILKKALPFPTCIPHDHWLSLVSADSNGMAYVPHSLISYRQHDKNVIGAKSTHQNNNRDTGRTRETVTKNRELRYAMLQEHASESFTPTNKRRLARLHGYYESFFKEKIRFGTLLFHLLHIRAFSYRKNFVQIAYGFLFSFCGDTSKWTISGRHIDESIQ